MSKLVSVGGNGNASNARRWGKGSSSRAPFPAVEEIQAQGDTASEKASNFSTALIRYDAKTVARETAKFICAKDLPYKFAGDEIFENFIQSYNPCGKRIPRSVLTREVDKMAGEWKLELLTVFSKLEQKISICSDIWSDYWKQYFFMSITCCWIDSSWTLQKRLIAYREFDVEQTAQNISIKLHSILQEYGLLTKVFSISFDTATTNTVGLSELIAYCQPSFGSKFFHVRNICYVLNLCVQDILSCLKESVQPIRNALSYLVRHTSLLKRWKKYCKQIGMPPRKFSLDYVPTRWNYTYKMLCGSYPYRNALCDFYANESRENNVSFAIFPQQWDACSCLCEVLHTFSEAITTLSGVYYPTSHLAVDQCVKMALLFSAYTHDEVLHEAIFHMKTKWLKHFSLMPDIFLLAKILDPRVRINGLDRLLNLYYNALFPNQDGPNVSSIMNDITNTLKDVYRDFKLNYGSNDDIHNVESLQASGSSFRFGKRGSMFKDLYELYYLHKHKHVGSASNVYLELDNYLTIRFEYDPQELDNFDILRWWSRRTTTFPILSMIAKEVLACPVSTLPVEQVFSIEGLTLSEHRSMLTVEHLENQCLLQDWVRANYRIQNEATMGTDSSDELDYQTTESEI